MEGTIEGIVAMGAFVMTAAGLGLLVRVFVRRPQHLEMDHRLEEADMNAMETKHQIERVLKAQRVVRR